MKINQTGLFVLSAALLIPIASGVAAENGQTITLGTNTQIPGTELKAGTYTFAVEDRLPDRAIVRVSNSQTGEHSLVLAVPDAKVPVTSDDNLAYFKTNGSDNKSVKAWKCADCAAPLEFVYPKLEAVKITGDTAETVMAVDPSYDKLPGNLSPDDMKVVTLWLLSPERVTASNTGEGVKAAKYVAPAATAAAADTVAANTNAATQAPVAAPASAATPAPTTPAPAVTPATASSPEPTAAPAPMSHRRQLPKTASDTYLYLTGGLAFLAAGLTLRWRRLSRA